MKTLIAIGCIAASIAVLTETTSMAYELKTQTFTLKDVSFLEGNWSSKTKSGALVEEFWSAPKADSMVGYCRFIKDQKTTFYELLSIVEKQGQVILRMRHFNESLVGWNDKEEAGDCILVTNDGADATFDNKNDAHHVMVTYKRSGTNSLHVVVEDTTDGKSVKHEFDYSKND